MNVLLKYRYSVVKNALPESSFGDAENVKAKNAGANDLYNHEPWPNARWPRLNTTEDDHFHVTLRNELCDSYGLFLYAVQTTRTAPRTNATAGSLSGVHYAVLSTYSTTQP